MSEPLGPAVTEAFPRAAGLHELIGRSVEEQAPAAPASAPEVPAVEFSPKLFLNALRLADRLASRALRVEPEEPETVEELAGAIAPLVQYYARGSSTLAALWGNLVVALVGVGFSKAEKIRTRQAPDPDDDGDRRGTFTDPEA